MALGYQEIFAEMELDKEIFPNKPVENEISIEKWVLIPFEFLKYPNIIVA